MSDPWLYFTPATEAEAAEALVLCASQVLERAQKLLPLIPPDALAHHSRLLPGSTIGKHLRHVLVPYMQVTEAALADGRVVDYDTSAGPRRLESDPDALSEALRRVQSATLALAPHLNKHIRVHATTPIPQTLPSTIARELWFCALHALHHYTTIRTILTSELHVEGVDPDLDFNPATIRRRDEHRDRCPPRSRL